MSAGRRRVPRRVVAAAVLAVAGALGGVLWIVEPLQRERELLRVPVRLGTGETARGDFTPEHEGPYGVVVRFARTAPIDRIGELVRGGWTAPGPAGLTLSWSIRHGDDPPLRGVTGEAFPADRFAYGGNEPGVEIAAVRAGRAVPSTIEVRVDRAVEGLADLRAVVAVEPIGDWVSYAWLEAVLRFVVMSFVVGVLAVGFLIARWIRWRANMARMSDAGAEGGGAPSAR